MHSDLSLPVISKVTKMARTGLMEPVALKRMESQPCITMLKALADETRWRIVRELLVEPMTVGQITARLDASQYNVSKHLRILREARIVQTQKDGQHVECAIADGFRKRLAQNKNVLDLGCCTFRFDQPPK
jgi:DNA-binding transcriptional ArsR family regulator